MHAGGRLREVNTLQFANLFGSLNGDRVRLLGEYPLWFDCSCFPCFALKPIV